MGVSPRKRATSPVGAAASIRRCPTTPAGFPIASTSRSPRDGRARSKPSTRSWTSAGRCARSAPTQSRERLIEQAILSASTAPSGAHQQPWTFVAVSDPETRRRIRFAAEAEERRSYENRMSDGVARRAGAAGHRLAEAVPRDRALAGGALRADPRHVPRRHPQEALLRSRVGGDRGRHVHRRGPPHGPGHADAHAQPHGLPHHDPRAATQRAPVRALPGGLPGGRCDRAGPGAQAAVRGIAVFDPPLADPDEDD